VRSITATCFDSREELVRKYAQAGEHIDEILGAGMREGGRDGSNEKQGDDEDDEVYNTDDEVEDDEHEQGQTKSLEHVTKRDNATAPIETKVLYSIDATKLHTYKPFKKSTQNFTRIVFNFPHVGGKSTDVNRQVRYNQALLHDFFVSAKTLLTKDMNKEKEKEYDGEKTGANDVPVGERRRKGKKQNKERAEKKVDSTILVTLFEGVPYTLWNIKDLARSAGLKVLRSWAFRSEVYPGYEHARTLGNIRAKEDIAGAVDVGNSAQKHDESSEKGDEGTKGTDDDWSGFDDADDDEGDDDDDHDEDDEATGEKASATRGIAASDPSAKRPGRWRGEERAARTYEFGLVEDEKQKSASIKKPSSEHDEDEFEKFKKKRKRKGGKLFDEDASSEGEK